MLDRLDIEDFGAYALQGWYNGYLPIEPRLRSPPWRARHTMTSSR